MQVHTILLEKEMNDFQYYFSVDIISQSSSLVKS